MQRYVFFKLQHGINDRAQQLSKALTIKYPEGMHAQLYLDDAVPPFHTKSKGPV